MKGISIKLKYIYLRHILISVLSVFFYTYLTYLNSKHGFLEIKEEYIEFFFPILLAVIVITIWLRKPILMLDLHGIERGFFFYYLVASVSIIVPAMIAQKYLESSNEELKIIQSFEEIDRLNYYDCYKIIDFSIDKSEAAVYRNTREIGGKVSSRKYFNSQFALPIKDNSKSKKIWLGIKYTNSIINHQSKLIEEKKGKELYIESNENFYEFSKTDIKYLKLLPASEDKSGFINAITKQIY